MRPNGWRAGKWSGRASALHYQLPTPAPTKKNSAAGALPAPKRGVALHSSLIMSPVKPDWGPGVSRDRPVVEHAVYPG